MMAHFNPQFGNSSLRILSSSFMAPCSFSTGYNTKAAQKAFLADVGRVVGSGEVARGRKGTQALS